MTVIFENRDKAGDALLKKLLSFNDADSLVFALPRGGVPVAIAVARGLGAPLGLLFVKKIGAPGHAEYAIGAIVDGIEPIRILRNEIIEALHVSDLYVSAESDSALTEIERRRRLYAGLYADISPKNKTAIIVDDGLATGASMEAAVEALRRRGAAKIVIAIPVAPEETVAGLKEIADSVVCVSTPSEFRAVGAHYADFPQLTDADVMELLDKYIGGGKKNSAVQKRA